MQRAQHDLCGKPNKRLVIDMADMPNAATVVHSNPEILGGTPVFVGTRLLFRNLIDYLERNHSLDEFLDWAATNCQSFVSQRSAPRATDSRTADFLRNSWLANRSSR